MKTPYLTILSVIGIVMVFAYMEYAATRMEKTHYEGNQ